MRLRAEIDPRIRYDLESMEKQARWSMETPEGSCEYNIYHRPSSRHSNVRVFDVYLVDNTRIGRDPDAGRPIYLGTAPFREQAEEFIRDHMNGKRVFFFRGFKTEFKAQPIKRETTLIPPHIESK